MKSGSISLRRRQLLITGVAGGAAPSIVHAVSGTGTGMPAVERGAGGLVVSGRIVTADGLPLAGAGVEVWPANGRERAAAVTDGDGRFFATIGSGQRGRPRQIHYRVTRAGRTLAGDELHFARGREVAEQRTGHIHRDSAGDWRAAFGVTVA